MNYIIVKTSAILTPLAALKAAREIREVADETGIILLDGRFDYPPTYFSADGVVSVSVCDCDKCSIQRENEFLRENRDKLRAAVQTGIEKYKEPEKRADELNARANRYFDEKEELIHKEIYRNDRTIKKVEQALGIKLYEWQKEFVFYKTQYGENIKSGRRNGKTLAHVLRLCLSDGEPIIATLNPASKARNEFLKYLGEDGCTIKRSQFFISELKNIYCALKRAGGIGLREIIF